MKNFLFGGVTGFLLGVGAFYVWTGQDNSPQMASPPLEDTSPSAQSEEEQEPRVTGIGGVFFKTENPAELKAWYEKHLGLVPYIAEGHLNFCWETYNSSKKGRTVWGPFSDSSKYFDPGTRDYMHNFRVVHLDQLLEKLRAEGVTVFDEIEEYEYGRFAWILDGSGVKVELWEPKEDHYSEADWDLACTLK